MPSREKLSEFTAWTQETFTGDKKGLLFQIAGLFGGGCILYQRLPTPFESNHYIFAPG
jgi:hypothetical protein